MNSKISQPPWLHATQQEWMTLLRIFFFHKQYYWGFCSLPFEVFPKDVFQCSTYIPMMGRNNTGGSGGKDKDRLLSNQVTTPKALLLFVCLFGDGGGGFVFCLDFVCLFVLGGSRKNICLVAILSSSSYLIFTLCNISSYFHSPILLTL